MSQQQEAPVSITSARSGRSADIRRREIKYLISMGIRTVCFVLAILVTGPARWILVAAAFLLPYFAVVIANAADGRKYAEPEPFEPEGLTQISPAAPALEQSHDTPIET